MRGKRACVSALLLAFGCSSGGSADGTGGTVGTGGISATGGASGGQAGGSSSGGASGGQAGGRVSTGGHDGSAGRGSTGGTSAATGGSGGHAGGRAGTGGASTGGQAGAAAAGGAAGAPDLANWTLTWSDEFNGADGSAVDAAKWIHDVGGDGWGNQELEYYTDGTQNAVVQGGNLVITATTAGASGHTCSYPSSGACKYTSARLLTKGKFSQKYGRIEARIQIPKGQGIWPAFWMLGANIDSAGWPSCGEIDIMENVGREPTINHGSMHMAASGTKNDSQLTGMYALSGGASLGDAFHTYAIEWSATAIGFFVDDTLYETQTPQTATGRTWAFDQPFFIILNVAVGGQWPGSPDGTTTFPQTMKVDWVRVYKPAP